MTKSLKIQENTIQWISKLDVYPRLTRVWLIWFLLRRLSPDTDIDNNYVCGKKREREVERMREGEGTRKNGKIEGRNQWETGIPDSAAVFNYSSSSFGTYFFLILPPLNLINHFQTFLLFLSPQNVLSKAVVSIPFLLTK